MMRTLLVLAALVTASLLVSASPPLAGRTDGADDDDEVTRLRERLDVLEKTVLADPYRPTKTVLARLSSAEEAIEKLRKRDAQAESDTDADAKTVREALSAMEKDDEDLQRRVKTLEDQARRRDGNAGAAAGQVAELERDLARLSRSVDDLSARVKRLESKK